MTVHVLPVLFTFRAHTAVWGQILSGLTVYKLSSHAKINVKLIKVSDMWEMATTVFGKFHKHCLTSECYQPFYEFHQDWQASQKTPSESFDSFVP